MPKNIESQPSSEGKIPEGIPVEGALSGKDLEDLKATSKEAGDWVENKAGVLEFVKKEDSEIEAMTQSAEIARLEEIKNPEKIEGLKQKLDELYKEKVDSNEFIQAGFENASEEQKNELRRQTGLSDSKIEALMQAIQEKDSKKIKIIQDSIKPMRQIDFDYQDQLLDGEKRDEGGNLINKDWKAPRGRKKLGEK